HRWLVSQLAAQRLARRIELAPLTTHAARPGVLAERVDHGPSDAPFGERLELNPPTLIEPVRGVDETKAAVLHQVADVDGVRHRGGHASGERFDERQSGNDPAILTWGDRLGAHLLSSPGPRLRRLEAFASLPAGARYRNRGTNGRGRVQNRRT